ncbi:hypothetical protein RchiOBHm_Chr2g0173871 [Rosa chinensis]|uniref:Uncharacterized protein n=1 Tax=Rosa chinensis TaxID=74649 RepID=A0A2P6S605_ROSCH|nr:hypothetical protein RchiOBHm_Chr2g0173871 [Rosa chinensis]
MMILSSHSIEIWFLDQLNSSCFCLRMITLLFRFEVRVQFPASLSNMPNLIAISALWTRAIRKAWWRSLLIKWD